MRPWKTACVAIGFLFFAGILQAQTVFDAVVKKDLAKVKEFVEKDPKWVKIKVTDQKNTTLLHYAAMVDQAEIAAYLIDKGADVNAIRTDFLTPLMLAGSHVAEVLVDKGADLDYATPEGITAIYYAVLRDRRDVFERLLEHGPKLPEAGTYGAGVILEYGMQIGSLKCLDSYARQGLSPLFENNAGMTLAHFAAESPSLELFRRLVDFGAPLGQADIYGWTPLHTAARNGNKPVVEFLIKSGLDKNARTIDGKSAYLLAREANQSEVAAYLVSIGAEQSAGRPPVLAGEYFGQPRPGKEPRPFVPALPGIERGLHGIFSFSPDGKVAYWKPVWSPNTAIHESKREGDKWTVPGISSFSAEDQGDDVPFVSPDGKKLFFLSQRPAKGKELPFPYIEKIWMMDKTPAGWSTPKKLPEIVNATEGMHWQVSVDGAGHLYFGARGGIHYAAFKDGTYAKPVRLGTAVNNGKEAAFSPFISPDGGYLLFGREDPYSTYRIFISFKKPDGTWTEASNLSPYLKQEYCLNPRVSTDGKYLFFSGDHGVTYWVEASFLKDLRPKEGK